MLRQDELALHNALSSVQLPSALLRELRKAVANGKKKKRPTVPAGSRSTPFVGVSIASHHSSAKVAGKRKAN